MNSYFVTKPDRSRKRTQYTADALAAAIAGLSLRGKL